ncbi:MAG TPA: hypothetical protein VNJ71_07370 [Gemmatimonadales bacterium]|nr:hypothetical protein [Gemmatimonadales bacterium]
MSDGRCHVSMLRSRWRTGGYDLAGEGSAVPERPIEHYRLERWWVPAERRGRQRGAPPEERAPRRQSGATVDSYSA